MLKKNKKMFNFLLFSKKKLIIKNKKKMLINLNSNFFLGNIISKKKHVDVFNGIIVNRCVYFKKNIKKINLLKKQYFLSKILFFFKKLIFKGKGFKIKKINSNLIVFFFGHSHLKLFYNKNFIIKKYLKNKYLFFSTNLKKLKLISTFLLTIKKISWYTKRGLRLKKQIVQKRSGKKSSN